MYCLPKRFRRAALRDFRLAASRLDKKVCEAFASRKIPSICIALWKRRTRESWLSPSRRETSNGIVYPHLLIRCNRRCMGRSAPAHTIAGFPDVIWIWCSSPGSIPVYRHEAGRVLLSACRTGRKLRDTSGEGRYFCSCHHHYCHHNALTFWSNGKKGNAWAHW